MAKKTMLTDLRDAADVMSLSQCKGGLRREGIHFYGGGAVLSLRLR